VFLDGDARGKPHLFPNTIVKVRDSAFKDPKQQEMLLKVHYLFSKYGTPYILNMLPKWQHGAVNSMGCRTRLSGDWADRQGYPNPRYSTMRTGNIHYNTINLPRIAIEANGDDNRSSRSSTRGSTSSASRSRSSTSSSRGASTITSSCRSSPRKA